MTDSTLGLGRADTTATLIIHFDLFVCCCSDKLILNKFTGQQYVIICQMNMSLYNVILYYLIDY